MKIAQPALPVHYELSRAQLVFSTLWIAAATGLLALHVWRVATIVDLRHWWVPLVVFAGFAAADAASGLVHWALDTWGDDDCPLIGRRLLVPFRVHHVNPDDFLRRRFVDTNGEVAGAAVVLLLALLAVPLDSAAGSAVALFGLAFCGLGALTNQIHQWAHMPEPPAAVRALQGCGLLLGHAEHAAHHARPHDRHYCITTGWWNALFDAAGVFRRLESAITWITGIAPRQSEGHYEARYGASKGQIEPGGVSADA